MILQYILKLSISLAIVWLFYQCVLRRLTFYGANRWYLAGYSFLCLFIPFININPFLESNRLSGPIVDLFPSVEKYAGVVHQTTGQSIAANAGSLSGWDWMALTILAGTAIFFCQFLIRCISFLKMRRKAKLISTDGIRLYQVNESIIPFSFGNSVFINADLHTESELQEIIRHEFVHVKNRHTVDILWSEWLCILNWYNPFAWLLRSSIRQNLEFIADKKVLEEGLNKKEYQYLLLKVIGNNHFSIAPKFNFSSLKKRIAMMNKFKSARISALRFLFLVPLLSVLLLAFRQIAPHDRIDPPAPPPKQAPKPAMSIAMDDIKAPQGPGIRDTMPVVPINEKGYYIDIRGEGLGQVVIVRDKEYSEVKKVPLAEWNKNEEEYTALYGKIVRRPFPPDPPSPPSKAGNAGIGTISEEFSIDDETATIKLKDGSVESYNLKNAKERKAFEHKYGRMITIPVKANAATVSVVSTNEVTSVTPAKADNIKTSISGIAVSSSPVSVINVGSEAVTVLPVKANATAGGQTVIAPITTTTTEGITIVRDYDYSMPGKEDVIATITRKTTKAELEEIKEQLKAKGITLTYETVEYDNKGILVMIYGSMKSSDGSTNFVAKDFSKLVLSIIKYENNTYFKVTVKDDKVRI